MDLKTLIKKLGHQKKIEPQRLDKSNMLRVTDLLTFTLPTESTLPFQISSKEMYSMVITGVRLENYL
jgi:hypothetical protein